MGGAVQKNFVEYQGKTFYYIAENDEKAAGNLALGRSRDDDRPNAGEIYGIYLLPECWGQGFGKKFMDFGVNKLRETGFTDIILWVLEDNARARKFYERYGFAVDGTRKEITIGKPLWEVRYALRIAE